jgi:hypothetical protein
MADIATISADGVTLVKFTDGIAEIIVDPTSKAITADELARFMLANDVIAAKVVINSGRIETKPGISGPESNAASFFSKET